MSDLKENKAVEEKAQKKNKPSFLKTVKVEMKKITWYPAKTTLKNSIWVTVALIICAAITGVVDLGLSEGLSLLTKLF